MLRTCQRTSRCGLWCEMGGLGANWEMLRCFMLGMNFTMLVSLAGQPGNEGVRLWSREPWKHMLHEQCAAVLVSSPRALFMKALRQPNMRPLLQSSPPIPPTHDLTFSYSVEPLRTALASAPTPPATSDSGSKLLRATKELFADMGRGGMPFPPIGFLYNLRWVQGVTGRVMYRSFNLSPRSSA